MNEQDPLLKIRFDGQAIGPGRIPVAHLLRFLSNLNKALQRTGRVLSGANESTSQGRPPRSIKEEIALDLVFLKEGSPAAVLGLEGRENEAAELIPKGTPISHGFWESPTLEELADSQHVHPLKDVSMLFRTWPGEDDDEFEEAIDELRHQNMLGGNRS